MFDSNMFVFQYFYYGFDLFLGLLKSRVKIKRLNVAYFRQCCYVVALDVIRFYMLIVHCFD